MSEHKGSADQSGQYRLGVIVNARSGRNRAGTTALDAMLAQHPHIPVERPAAPDATAAALATLAARGVNLLAICGGDGTVQQVLNVILEPGSPFAELPLLAVLPGGTTNMIAHDINEANRPAAVLEKILGHLSGELSGDAIAERPVMRLTGGDAPAPAYGLFFGAAGIHEATMQNRGSVDAVGLRDGFGPGLRLLAVLFKIAIGRDPFAAVPMRIAIDGRPYGEKPCVAILGTTMNKLSLGLMPFWGSGPGRLRLTMVFEGSRSIIRAIRLALAGRPHPLLMPANGYDSLNADRIELGFEGGCVLDGESFHATPDRPIVLETGGILRFLLG